MAIQYSDALVLQEFIKNIFDMHDSYTENSSSGSSQIRIDDKFHMYYCCRDNAMDFNLYTANRPILSISPAHYLDNTRFRNTKDSIIVIDSSSTEVELDYRHKNGDEIPYFQIPVSYKNEDEFDSQYFQNSLVLDDEYQLAAIMCTPLIQDVMWSSYCVEINMNSMIEHKVFDILTNGTIATLNWHLRNDY